MAGPDGRFRDQESIMGEKELSESASASASSGASMSKSATGLVAVVEFMLACPACLSSADGGNWGGCESSSSVASESGITTGDLAVDAGGGAVAWEWISIER